MFTRKQRKKRKHELSPETSQEECRACQGQHRGHTCKRRRKKIKAMEAAVPPPLPEAVVDPMEVETTATTIVTATTATANAPSSFYALMSRCLDILFVN